MSKDIPSADAPPADLTALSPGDSGRLLGDELNESERQLLAALGLAGDARFRLCQAGNPWIIEVRGTRIGLADDVARRLRVTPA